MTRPIIFERGIRDDAAMLTREQDRTVQAFLKQAAAAVNPYALPFEDIVPCAGPLRGWHRWKPSTLVRNLCECEVRVVYRVEQGELIVLAVRQRDDVYREAAYRAKRLINAWPSPK